MAKAGDAYFAFPHQVEAFGFDWGRLALTVGPDVNGAGRFSGGVVDVAPGMGHARHNHPGAEEIIFVVSGTGEQMVEDDEGRPITRDVGPGCTIYVPESRYHATLNTGPGRCGCSSSTRRPVPNWRSATCRISASSRPTRADADLLEPVQAVPPRFQPRPASPNIS